MRLCLQNIKLQNSSEDVKRKSVFPLRLRSNARHPNRQLNRNLCQATLPTSTFLTRRDGSIVSDRVSLHAFTQHSFEELQGPLPLLDFPASTDCKFVRDCVSLRTFSQYSSEELQGLLPLPAFFTRHDDSIVSEHVLL